MVSRAWIWRIAKRKIPVADPSFRVSESDERINDLVDKLVLDIKALVLLQGSEGDLKKRLETGISGSHDESVKLFVKSLQSGRKPESNRLIAMALGELVLASLLVVAGTLALIPIMVGITSPQDLINYFANRLYEGIALSPFYQYTAFIEFGLGLVLILSAFYTLRQAAANLKEMGLAIKTGE